ENAPEVVRVAARADEIEYGDAGHDRLPQVRPFRHGNAAEETAVRSSHQRELLARGHARRDELLGDREEVRVAVLLVLHTAALPPRWADPGAAAQVRVDDRPACGDEGGGRRGKLREPGRVETAVRIEQRRAGARTRRRGGPDGVVRDARAVRRGRDMI